MLLNVNITTLLPAVSINHTVLNRPSWHLLNNSMGQTPETLHMQHPTNLINEQLLGVTTCIIMVWSCTSNCTCRWCLLPFPLNIACCPA